LPFQGQGSPWLLTATPFGAEAWGEGRVACVVVPGATSPWLLTAAPFGAESKTAQHQNWRGGLVLARPGACVWAYADTSMIRQRVFCRAPGGAAFGRFKLNNFAPDPR